MKIKITTIAVLLIVATSYAQLFPTLGGQRAGISTAQFLKIGVGGRATAMGDAFVAVANDASALYWNPAGIIQAKNDQVVFSHIEYLADIKHEFAGAIYHFDQDNAIGVAITALHMKDMPVTTEFNPTGTGEYFSFGDVALALTYSRRMTDQFSIGGTIRYIEENLDKIKMRGVMIDLGTYYWTGLGTSRFAVTVSNFGNNLEPTGSVIMSDGSKKSTWQSFSPPTIFRIGFAFEPYMTAENRVTLSAQLNHPNDNSENVSTGAEYSWRDIFYLRGGYKFNMEGQSFSAGAGVKIPVSIADVTVDYAYSDYSDLGATQRFSILLGL